jgi:hypothetical protein
MLNVWVSDFICIQNPLSVKVNLHYSTSEVLYPYIKSKLLNYTSYMWCLNKNSEILFQRAPKNVQLCYGNFHSKQENIVLH